jgi:hypothetical protein
MSAMTGSTAWRWNSLGAATREGDLARVVPEVRGAAREQHGRRLGPRHDRHQDARPAPRCGALGVNALVAVQHLHRLARGKAPPQPLGVEPGRRVVLQRRPHAE